MEGCFAGSRILPGGPGGWLLALDAAGGLESCAVDQPPGREAVDALLLLCSLRHQERQGRGRALCLRLAKG